MLQSLNLAPEHILARTSTHIYLAPHPLLCGHIAHYTVMPPAPAKSAAPASFHIIPDAAGCIVFTFDGRDFRGTFWGATTHTETVTSNQEAGMLYLFVEFLPGGARRLSGVPQAQHTNRRLPLALLDPTLFQAAQAAFEKAETAQDFFQSLNHFFLSRLHSIQPPCSDAAVQLALRHTNSVQEMARDTCYSERHLNRIFSDVLGINAKTWLRLQRINLALPLLQNPRLTLAETAQQAGYFDQSHFTHDFKQVCGVTPSAYRRNLSDFYNETYKFSDILVAADEAGHRIKGGNRDGI
ncbi:MAG: helix-turn-helix domain-containing protein [Oscillospiraceae bacterium]